MSKYVSDDTYVKKQKEDIEELATMFKGMLGKSEKEDEEAYIETFRAQFAPQLKPEVMDSIVDGRMTFQRAFMTGEMTAKGNFKILRMLDTMFNFAH